MLEHLIHTNTWFPRHEVELAEQKHFHVFVRLVPLASTDTSLSPSHLGEQIGPNHHHHDDHDRGEREESRAGNTSSPRRSLRFLFAFVGMIRSGWSSVSFVFFR